MKEAFGQKTHPCPSLCEREGKTLPPLLLPTREGQHKPSANLGGFSLSTITMFSANLGSSHTMVSASSASR